MPALILALCLLNLSSFGQAFTLADQPFLAVIAKPAPFSPTNITGCELFLNYLDLTANAKPSTWLNEIVGGVYLDNKGSTYPTNSSQGVYFDGGANSYFLTNSVSGKLNWHNLTDSTWVCFKAASTVGSFIAVLGSADLSGHGLFIRQVSTSTGQLSIYGTVGNFGLITTNVQYDVAYVRTNSGSGIFGTWTNGAYSTAVTAPTEFSLPFVWGVGKDADSDTVFIGYVKFVAVFTNYTLTASDIANLHAYATSH